MNDVQTPGSGADRRHRRIVIAIAGCAALAVLAVALLLAIGIRHVPDLPTVRERPDPTVAGRLALQVWDDSRGMCVDVEELSTGERREVYCEGMPVSGFEQPMGINWFDWDDTGRLMLASYERDAIRVVTIDVDTGEVVDEGTLPSDTRPPDERARADGSTLSYPWNEDGRAVVYVNGPDGARRTLYEVRGPDGYTFVAAAWSPRGDYAVVRDSEGRWIVLRADGEPVPRILTEDADQLAWYQP